MFLNTTNEISHALRTILVINKKQSKYRGLALIALFLVLILIGNPHFPLYRQDYPSTGIGQNRQNGKMANGKLKEEDVDNISDVFLAEYETAI